MKKGIALQQSDTDTSQYFLNEFGEFIITDYNSAKPFSSFFMIFG